MLLRFCGVTLFAEKVRSRKLTSFCSEVAFKKWVFFRAFWIHLKIARNLANSCSGEFAEQPMSLTYFAHRSALKTPVHGSTYSRIKLETAQKDLTGPVLASGRQRFCWRKEIRAFLRIVGLQFTSNDTLPNNQVCNRGFLCPVLCSVCHCDDGMVIVHVVSWYQTVAFSQVHEETQFGSDISLFEYGACGLGKW